MNKTKIEWTNFTWNPVTGCLHGCKYCYARRFEMRFRKHFNPTYYENRLTEPYEKKKPLKIFVCSTSDLFGDWVEASFIQKVIDVARGCPHHTFQFLTKNPKRYKEFVFPSNVWIGVTVENSEVMKERVDALMAAKFDGVKFVSFEPLMSEINYMPDVSWVIVGALSLGRKKVKPEDKWVASIISMARAKGISVFIKDNASWGEKIQEFPASQC